MSDELLTSALEAVRDTDVDDGELAAMTRSRIRRTLEARARGRRQMVSFLTMVSILLGGTMAYALSTGRTGELIAAVTETVVTGPIEVEPATSEVAPPIARPTVVAVVPPPAVEAPPPVEEPPPPPVEEAPPPPVEATPPPLTPPPAPRRAPAPIEGLYRKAHELHFHGADHAAALAAWDAYLAAEPTGRFVVEARYNRALILVRLGRYFEARAALQPFARGEVQPAGYRQREAGEIVERLDDLSKGD